MDVYWIENDPFFSHRSIPLIRSLEAYTNAKIHKLLNVDALIDESPKGRFLILLQHVSSKSAFDDMPKLRCHKIAHKSIIMAVDDTPFSIKTKRPAIDLTGGGSSGNIIPGYGFVPLELEGKEHFGMFEFNERKSVFGFTGALHGSTRARFLLKFQRLASVNYTIQQGVENKPVPKKLKADLSEKLVYEFYLEDMSRHKFSLVPKGFGHTFRFLESMAMGCVAIVEDISNLKFCKDVFKDGEHYLSVKNNMTQVIQRCKDNKEMQRIANNGRETYLRYFSTKNGSLPIDTVAPIIKSLGLSYAKVI
jgi:hypothetical protein